MSSKISKSELKDVIKEIVKGIFKEMSTTGAASPVSTPLAFSRRGSDPKEEVEELIDEGTADAEGYNIPSAFSGKGGSARGVAGSKALGYELTPTGKKDMERKGDRLR
jgi:hypothetical protein